MYLTKNKLFFVFYILLLVGIFDIFLFNKNFPITEGWWETYAYFYSKNFLPYKDFSLNFPPLYLYINYLLTDIFEFSFYKLRLFAILIHFTEVTALYYWLLKMTSSFRAAAFGTAIAVGLVMANPVYVAKDYHTYVSLFVIVTLISITKSNFKKDHSAPYIPIIFSGIFSGALILLKQNIGIFFSFGVLVFWALKPLVFFKVKKEQIKNLFLFAALFIFSFFIPLFIFTYNFGLDWILTYKNNDSKGNVIVALTRFITNKELIILELKSFAILIISLLLAKYKFIFAPLENKKFDISYFLILPALVFFIFFNYYLIIVALSWPLLRAFPFENKFWQSDNFLLFIPIYSLIYCGTLTAGFNVLGLEPIIALMFADLFKIFFDESLIKLKYRYISITTIIAIFFVLSIQAKLRGSAYSWWGLSTGGLSSKQFFLPFNELRGLSSDNKTYKMYSSILKVKDDLQANDQIFSYPSIPITYLLLKKDFVGAPVLWFDVAKADDGLNTLAQLENRKPKYIFWLRPPKNVYIGHFYLRMKDPAMLVVDKWLLNAIKEGRYKVVDTVESFYSNIYETSTQIKATFNIIDDKNNKVRESCLSLESCRIGNEYNGYTQFTLNSNLETTKFVESNRVILDHELFTFYVLKRTEN